MVQKEELEKKFELLREKNFDLYFRKGKYGLEEFKFNRLVLDNLEKVFSKLKLYYDHKMIFKLFGYSKKMKRGLCSLNLSCDVFLYNLAVIEAR